MICPFITTTTVEMDRVVHYHHPAAANFSLKYSSASPADLLSRRDELDGATKLIGYPFDTPVYALYESDTEIEAAGDMDFDEKCPYIAHR